MNILQVTAYAGPVPGNHIPSLIKVEEELKIRGGVNKTIYAVPETVRDTEWCKDLCKHATVYFLPVKHARIKYKTYRLINDIIKKEKIDVVHSHFELYDIPISLVAPKSVKVFWHLHDAISYGYKISSFSRKILWRIQYGIFAKNVTILSVSEKHLDFLVELGCVAQKLKYFPNALSLERIENTENFEKKREFLFFCWDYFLKGGDLAISACDKLKENNIDFVLRAVPFISCEKRDYIINQPPVKNINELYKNTGCFLHISRAEGLSYALLEAAYAGLPVICSDIPENLPLVDCPTVRYVRSENITDIYEAMRNMCDNDFKICKDDVRVTREIIKNRFSLDKWASDLINLYMEK